MKRALALLFVLFAAALAAIEPAFAQGTIVQSGPVTTGHGTVWFQNGYLQDMGPASGSGYGLTEELGITRGTSGSGPLGTHDCWYDQPPSSGAWHYLCFDPNTNGGGLISYGAGGSASPLPLNIDINGTFCTFPCGGSGISGITPVSTVAALRIANNLSGSTQIAISGYYQAGDGGAGLFSLGVPGCTDNGGTIIKDASGNCWLRQAPANQPVPVQWFGAKCDGVTVLADGSQTSGSTTFTNASTTFTSADVGKTFEENYGSAANPWIDTIASVQGPHQITTTDPAPAAFPGIISSSSALYNDPNSGNANYAFDSPGAGYVIGDTIAATPCTLPNCTTAATAHVIKVQFVGATINNGGSGYLNGDILTGTASGNSTTQVQAPQIIVTAVSSGAITAFSIVGGGQIKCHSCSADPSSLTWSGGSGSGFTTTLLANNASWGLWTVTQFGGGGSYTLAPQNPVSVVDNTTATASGGTINLNFSTQSYSYGTDDNAAIQAAENYRESLPVTMRGQTRTLSFPSGQACFADGITIQAVGGWMSSGPNESRLVQVLGAAGASINGSANGLVAIAPQIPANDQFAQEGWGPTQVSISNIAIIGMAHTPAITKGTTSNTAYSSGGIVAANPASGQIGAIGLYLSNVYVGDFPATNSALIYANKFAGDFRFSNVILSKTNTVDTPFTGTSTAGTATISGISTSDIAAINAALAKVGTLNFNGPGIPADTTVTAVGSSTVTLSQVAYSNNSTVQFIVSGGGDCLDGFGMDNPTRIVGFITDFCNIGLHLRGSKQWELHSWVAYTTNIDMEIEGWNRDNSEIDCFGCQFTDNNQEGLLLNQINENLFCYGCGFWRNFNDADGSTTSSVADANIVVGYRGGGPSGAPNTVATLVDPLLLGQSQGSTVDQNILFAGQEGNVIPVYCNCNIKLTGLNTQEATSGVPTVYPASQLFAVTNDGTFSATSIVCHAGGGQAGATPTYAAVNSVSGASAGDSCKLPPADGSGNSIQITNTGSASINEFPNGSDAINGLSASTAIAIAANKGEICRSPSAGTWDCAP